MPHIENDLTYSEFCRVNRHAIISSTGYHARKTGRTAIGIRYNWPLDDNFDGLVEVALVVAFSGGCIWCGIGRTRPNTHPSKVVENMTGVVGYLDESRTPYERAKARRQLIAFVKSHDMYKQFEAQNKK
jgi:hypothetical protein